jgi:hypothetical protein
MEKPMMSDLNRRNFIKSIFRIGAAGGLVTLGVILGLNSNDSITGTDDCTQTLPCRKCNQFSGCTQPKALATLKKSRVLTDSSQTNMWQTNGK